VEDDASVRTYVERALRALGYDVLATGDPFAALALLKTGEQWDVLLTDILMPGAIDGVDLGKRASEIRPDLSIVYMTGYADRVMEEVGQFLDPERVLHKPFRREQLGRAIALCLGQAGRMT